jgi:hypothetical protein
MPRLRRSGSFLASRSASLGLASLKQCYERSATALINQKGPAAETDLDGRPVIGAGYKVPTRVELGVLAAGMAPGGRMTASST